MSTVLWANYLSNNVVTCDESDKYALYKFSDKLDSICRNLGIKAFSSLCDLTDAEFNLNDAELPDNMVSTDELMAKNGNWTDPNDAFALLTALMAEIETKAIRFGLLSNAHDEVIAELRESLKFARIAVRESAQFNFSVVM